MRVDTCGPCETDLCAKDPSRGNRVRARAPRETPLSTRVPLVLRVVVLILRLFDPLCPVPLLQRIFGDSVDEVGGPGPVERGANGGGSSWRIRAGTPC